MLPQQCSGTKFHRTRLGSCTPFNGSVNIEYLLSNSLNFLRFCTFFILCRSCPCADHCCILLHWCSVYRLPPCRRLLYFSLGLNHVLKPLCQDTSPVHIQHGSFIIIHCPRLNGCGCLRLLPTPATASSVST